MTRNKHADRHLRELRLEECRVRDRHIDHLPELASSLTLLSLRGCTQLGAAAAAAAAQLTNLVALDLTRALPHLCLRLCLFTHLQARWARCA